MNPSQPLITSPPGATGNHTEGEFPGTGGTRIYWQGWIPAGNGPAGADSPLVLVVHGLGEHSGRYANVVNHLLPRGISLFALDHRGHGKSGGKRGHCNAFSEYLEDLDTLRSLAIEKSGRSRVIILGHSLGGLIALRYALEKQDVLSAVIVSSPFLGLRASVPRAKIILGRVLSRMLPAVTMDNQLNPEFLSHDSRVVKTYIEDPLVHRKVSARWFTETTLTQQWLHAHVHELSLPLLILQAGDDQIVDPDASEAICRKAGSSRKRFIAYPGFYHEIFNEIEKEKVFLDLENWIENLRS